MDKEISIRYKEFESVEDLNQSQKELLSEASKACLNAYAPYSGFKVGAAVRCSNGKIVTGNNQENAAYPSGLCAERIAVFAAMSVDSSTIEQLAITIKSEKGITEEPVAPCGACRQVLAEYEQKQSRKIEIIFSSESGKAIIVDGVDSLLPFVFNNKFLQ